MAHLHFQSWLLSKYRIDVASDGFKAYRETGFAIDINSALVVLDVILQVKEQDQSIMGTEDAAQVETTYTQLGHPSRFGDVYQLCPAEHQTD